MKAKRYFSQVNSITDNDMVIIQVDAEMLFHIIDEYKCIINDLIDGGDYKESKRFIDELMELEALKERLC